MFWGFAYLVEGFPAWGNVLLEVFVNFCCHWVIAGLSGLGALSVCVPGVAFAVVCGLWVSLVTLYGESSFPDSFAFSG